MAGNNIIEQILSLKSRQGGFTYEGSDKQEEIPVKWQISGGRKVVSQQNSQGASLRGEAESASLDSSIESKELLERKVCLKCQEEHQEMIYLANYSRPSGDGVCCSILRCIYDCMDIFEEASATNFGEGPLRTLMPECTHPLVEDGATPIMTRQPEVSINTAQVPSNEDKALTLKNEELPVLQEEDIVSTDL
ncbi:hypothetical protein [Endozoicomonas atrinae]|uniref:hypothetical protein n=1 Tax=Endozoicomonas atrinae TaxID=1333660 RepID=UPI0008270601|nr:hypothetical protein [Endozoicomonas atrinae]